MQSKYNKVKKKRSRRIKKPKKQTTETNLGDLRLIDYLLKSERP